MDKKAHIKIFTSIIFVFAFLAITPRFVHAASMYFSPSLGEYTVGRTLSVNVYVSSADQAMNAASGVVSFPQDKLEVVSLSKTGSIFTFWIQEPSFSNSAGTINFEGIALNPGFTGTAGKLIAVNFKVKAAGVAALNFSSGSVLANDGKGTNILSSLNDAQFNLNGAAPTVPKTTASFALPDTLSAPKVSSPTHPDPTKWYAQKDAKFIWPAPDGVIGVRLLVGKIPLAVPTVAYAPAISEKEVTNFEDGVWYFHAQFRNSGGWGKTAHFKLQIDAKSPEQFAIEFIDGKKTENPKPTIILDAQDSLSGIDYYRIKIGEEDFFSVTPEEIKNNRYALPLQKPGKRNILVQAYDKAGNYATAVEEFEILPIKLPIITEYPKELKDGELLVVRGSTYINSQTIIFLQKGEEEPKRFIVQSDKDGKFNFIAEDKLKEGVYKIWVVVINAQGVQSLPTEKITIKALQPIASRVGTWAISLLVIAIPLMALLFVLIFIVWYGWHKFSLLKKRLQKETREAESALHKSFDLLNENILDYIRLLDKTRNKRQLTEEEEKIIKHMKKHFDIAEKSVQKEIEDIEKEIK